MRRSSFSDMVNVMKHEVGAFTFHSMEELQGLLERLGYDQG